MWEKQNLDTFFLHFPRYLDPSITESGSEDYRYTGKPEDPSGLYYYGARYYDPLIGRFTTRDTVFGGLGDPQSQNRYAYCRNNPHKYIDPTGHWWETALDVGMLIIDANEYRENPNWKTGGILLLDIAFILAPLPNALGFIDNVDEIGDAVNVIDDAVDAVDGFSDFIHEIDRAEEAIISSNNFANSLGDALGHQNRHLENRYVDEIAWNNGIRQEVSDGLIDIQTGLLGGQYEMYYQPQGGHNEAAILYNTQSKWMTCFNSQRGVTHYTMDLTQVRGKLGDQWLRFIP